MRSKFFVGLAVTITISLGDISPVLGGEYPQVQALGGIISGSPSCTSPYDSTRDVTCAVKGLDNSLYGIRFNPRTNYQSTFMLLGPKVVGDPSCTNTEDSRTHGEVTCAFVGSDGFLYGIRFNPRSRSVSQLASFKQRRVSGDPSCVESSDTFDIADSATCVVKGDNGDVLAFQFNPRTTSTMRYRSLGLKSYGNPSCVGIGTIICAWKGARNELYAVEFAFGRTQPPWQQYLGGILVEDPICTRSSFSPISRIGTITCTAKGLRNGLHGIQFDPSAQFSTGFQQLGGVLTDRPGCAAVGNGVMCAVKDTGNGLWDIFWDIGVSAPRILRNFRSWGKDVLDNPSCADVNDALPGQVVCAFKGRDNALYGIALTEG